MLDFDSKIEIANCSKLWRILNTSLDNVLLQCVAEERSEKKELGSDYFVIMQALLFLAVLMRCYRSVIEN